MGRAIIFVEASTTGAGACANQLARADGLHIVLLTREPGRYGPEILSFVDKILVCDTNNPIEVSNTARQQSQSFDVAAVTTTADMYVPQAALAARLLNLPGLSYEAALSARNKHRMRIALAEHAAEYNVPFFLAQSRDDAICGAAQLGFPLVIKPQEENDGYGVRRINNQRELEEYIEIALAWSRNAADQLMPRGVLLEAYCSGTEFSVETIQYPGGRCQIIGVASKEMVGIDRNHFIEAGHSFPYLGAEAMAAIAATRRALAALNIDHGAAHTECRVSGNETRVIEINPRLAGGKIGSHLIEMATGRSAVRAVLDAALGKNPSWAPMRNSGAAIHFLFADVPGIFRGIENVGELLRMPGITTVSPIAKPGEYVHPPSSNRDYVAEILSIGRTATEAHDRVIAAFQRTRLHIDSI
ncbi:pyridoxal-phosphate dependent enzyme [Bradyrhizobium lablabi]|uniref:Pyridoxal-phosphate dependent enzyme n=1 Tax=Bradyrhizobium lablabi TaxID=722472 RepID=A0A0R3MBA8_9BRAD|nr:ATP-grasp domain-containing protein [Bradyrhizobium lablabi]KRR17586.1 pyridoxal-phosphate dependent enzyme [Bradyrhizobium lablabi]